MCRPRCARIRVVTLAVITLILGVFASLALPTVARRLDPKRSDQADKTAARLGEAIKDEIKTLGDHEWAGEYYQGDGLGVNVSMILAPNSGYLFEWHGCLGLYDRNYGTVVLRQGRLRLSFTFANKRQGFQGIAEEFIPVSWGDRKYLIPSDDVVGFCNEVNDGSEPRTSLHGSYLLRDGDEQKEVAGVPTVPSQFEPYLLAGPIEAVITEIGDFTTRPSLGEWKFQDTVVTLNVGKRDGILPGMELCVIEPNDIVESVRIHEVKDEESVGVMTQIGEEEDGPRIGWKLSTRAPWNVQ